MITTRARITSCLSLRQGILCPEVFGVNTVTKKALTLHPTRGSPKTSTTILWCKLFADNATFYLLIRRWTCTLTLALAFLFLRKKVDENSLIRYKKIFQNDKSFPNFGYRNVQKKKRRKILVIILIILPSLQEFNFLHNFFVCFSFILPVKKRSLRIKIELNILLVKEIS